MPTYAVLQVVAQELAISAKFSVVVCAKILILVVAAVVLLVTCLLPGNAHAVLAVEIFATGATRFGKRARKNHNHQKNADDSRAFLHTYDPDDQFSSALLSTASETGPVKFCSPRWTLCDDGTFALVK